MTQRGVAGIAVLLLLAMQMTGCSIDKLYQMAQRRKVYANEQVTFKDMTNRYFLKTQLSPGTIEGVYSVSGQVIRKGKSLLSANEKEKTTERRENYSKVAIIRDAGSPTREFMEVSLDKEYQPSFPIVGEFTRASDASLFVYKHIERKGKVTSYTFTYDRTTDILEGIRTENKNAFTYTYKLTYLKLLPKTSGGM